MLLTLCDIVLIVLWTSLYAIIYQHMFPPRNLLLVYGQPHALELLGKLKQRGDRYQIKQVVAAEVGEDNIVAMAEGYDGVMLCDIPTVTRNYILKECFDKSIRVYMTPKISDILVRSSREMHTFDTPLLLSRNNGLTAEQLFGKRCLDIVVSFLMIILAFPVMLLTALAVKLYDGGSAIYKQKRLTLDGREFYVYKFRSMRMDSEREGAQLARKDDDRITPVGRIIRRTHFDELPQIFNILKGEMSFVGPRPEREIIAKEYEMVIPEFSFRLKVKAGLTGYAQIYGKYNTTPYDKLKLDLTYIENYSFWLDIKLMLMTFKIIFQKENTEGIDKKQKTAIRRQN